MHWFVLLNWLSEIRDAVLAVTERESSSHSSETEYFLQNVGNAKEAYLKKMHKFKHLSWIWFCFSEATYAPLCAENHRLTGTDLECKGVFKIILFRNIYKQKGMILRMCSSKYVTFLSPKMFWVKRISYAGSSSRSVLAGHQSGASLFALCLWSTVVFLSMTFLLTLQNAKIKENVLKTINLMCMLDVVGVVGDLNERHI